MATSLKKFSAGDLARAINVELTRGRPSAELRANLEAAVQKDIAAGKIKVRSGKLVNA
jgi:hypothetical protein